MYRIVEQSELVAREGQVPLQAHAFSKESRQALIKNGCVIYTLTGRNLRDLIFNAHMRFQEMWFLDQDFAALSSRTSEVAFNPKDFIWRKKSNQPFKPLEVLLDEYTEKIGGKTSGIKAILGEVSDYSELVFTHQAKTGEYLFGKMHRYRYTITKTMVDAVSDPGIVMVGHNIKQRTYAGYELISGLNIDLLFQWNRNLGNIGITPLIIPVRD